MPSPMTAVIAGSPASVAGILISTLGGRRSCAARRPGRWCPGSRGPAGVDLDADAAVDVVGAWKMPVNRSQASRTSSVVTSRRCRRRRHPGGQLVELLLVDAPSLRAAWKIDGLVVTPLMWPGLDQVLQVCPSAGAGGTGHRATGIRPGRSDRQDGRSWCELLEQWMVTGLVGWARISPRRPGWRGRRRRRPWLVMPNLVNRVLRRRRRRSARGRRVCRGRRASATRVGRWRLPR